MTNLAAKRIQKELVDFMKNEDFAKCGVYFEVGSSLTDLKGKIAGPPGTPYEGGTFVVKIKIPLTYPFKPPKIRFLTKIWHPHICPDSGSICLDVLDDAWTSGMTIRTTLLSIRVILAHPEPDHVEDSPEMFEQTARHWAQAYAEAPGSIPDFEDKIKRIVDMGKKNGNSNVDEHDARMALTDYSWDLHSAADSLFMFG